MLKKGLDQKHALLWSLRFLRRLLFFWIFVVTSSTLFAQDTLRVHQANVQLKPLIIPQSERFWLNGRALESNEYTLDYRFGRLQLGARPDSNSVLIAQYRVFNFNLQDRYVRYRLKTVNEDTLLLSGIPNPPEVQNAQFAGSNLQRSGTISRGITAGNRQDLSVQSGFKMALSGEITEGVRLNALLTDENTPIQPEGNTQRLNDFDTVLIQLAAKKWGLTLGDFNYVTSNTEFGQFARKLQGAQLQLNHRFRPETPTDSIPDLRVQLAGATARGLFRTQSLTIQEGVQGPYRLEGQNGEPFIIVLAGTEKVYLDGQLLVRGDDADYVMDYDAGEIRFTIKRLMTREKRVVIEFEYTTQRFTRSLVGAEVQVGFGAKRQGKNPIRLNFSILQEKDGSGFSEELGLTDTELSLIKASGDLPATLSGATPIPYAIDAPFTQYFQADTLYQGTVYSVFKPITKPEHTQLPLYRVRFTRIGEGLGDYKRVGNIEQINGLTFQWVGAGKGDYAAMRILPQPKNQQLMDVQAQWDVAQGITVFSEFASSQLDKNRISSISDEDNGGVAWLSGLRLQRAFEKDWQLSGEFRHRFAHNRFEPLGRVRGIEFGREWNLSPNSGIGSALSGENEVRQEAQFRLHRKHTALQAQFGNIGFGRRFSAQRWKGEVQFNEPNLPFLRYLLEKVGSADSTQTYPIRGNWLRQNGELSYPYKKMRWGFLFDAENRKQRHIQPDTLIQGSFTFWEAKPTFSWRNPKSEWELSYAFRSDDGWYRGNVVPESQAHTLKVAYKFNPVQAFNAEGELGYRKKLYQDLFANLRRSEVPSVVVQQRIRYRPFKQAIDLQIGYDALTEKANVMQEIYREVQVGQGDFVYEDLNADGIRQIDEYLPTIDRFRGNFIRLLVPSDSLRNVLNVNAKLRFALQPEKWFVPTKNGLPVTGWRKTLNLFSTQTQVEVREKSEDEAVRRIYLLDPKLLQNPISTLNGFFRFQQDLFLWRNRADFGGQLGFMQQNSLNRLAGGNEVRQLNRWSMDWRYLASNALTLKLGIQKEQNRSESGFASRSYNIGSYSIAPELQYQRGINGSFGMKAILEQKKDVAVNPVRQLNGFRIPMELRWNYRQKLQSSFNFEYANLKLTGVADGLAAFELTDGRGSGRSLLWNTMMQYNLSAILRATFFYDARLPQDSPVLHTLRFQLSAHF